MRDAAKVNLDNTTATEEDKDWARKFLYPDLRSTYRLFYNKEGYKHAADLVAKARAASRQEFEAKTTQTRESIYRATRNGKDIPVTDDDVHAFDKLFKNFDTLFKDMGDLFKRRK